MVQTRWSSVLLLYGVGLIASSFLGKIAPVGPLLQRDLWPHAWRSGLDGLGDHRHRWRARRRGRLLLADFGARRALLGLVIGGAGAHAAGSGANVLIAARALEGVGYLLVVVAAPTLIVRLSRGPDQASALALWGPSSRSVWRSAHLPARSPPPSDGAVG